MSDIYIEGMDAYLDGLLPDRESVLAEMEAHADKHSFPIVGPQVGHFLQQISAIKKPARIFEMGSGFGYSACWFARGHEDAEIICTETDEKNIRLGEKWLKQAGFSNRVHFHLGAAENILPGIGGQFEMIFNDADKHQYPEMFHLALEHLPPGGILMTDNVLWHARVLSPRPDDADTRGVLEYNRLIFHTPGVFSSILPVRDGIAVSIKR